MAGVLHRMITNKPVFERVDNDKEAMHRRKNAPNISKRLPAQLRHSFEKLSHQIQQSDQQTDMRLQIDCGSVCLFRRYLPRYRWYPSLHTSVTLLQNKLSPDAYALHLLSLSGGDSALINRFAYSFAQVDNGTRRIYEQVWHYLQHLPEATQRAFYVLACLGGKASTSTTQICWCIERQLTKQLEKTSHWVRKEAAVASVCWCCTPSVLTSDSS